jgi:hypothetical protein
MIGRGGLAAIAVFGALAAAAGCSSDRSYALVTVRSASGELVDVTKLAVYLNNADTSCDILYYPRTEGAPFRITPTEPVDFSVSFAASHRGLLRIGVEPRNAAMGSIGYGQEQKTIEPGDTVTFDVSVTAHALPPPLVGGCIGVSTVSCRPAGATGCGPEQTCHLSCRAEQPVTMCQPGGTRKPGETCTDNGQCEPGSQCLEYPCTGDKPRVCMRFCTDDSTCGGGQCTNRIPCGGQPTDHRTCSLPCDPRGSGVGTCAPGLSCFIFPGEIARCECSGAERSGGDGASCEDARNCQPGLLCVGPSGGRVCRPICKLDQANDCAGGRACARLVDPDYKTWGACLP